jgi:glycosyltransferase involved in cell wall biosynthesis
MNIPSQGSQSEWPLVSVITPVYNGEAYLEGVIQSIQDQDYPNVEHIVLDDGSSDGTLDIIKRYDGRIRWDSHENMGEARTVNKGFGMARGEVIAAVNSDDPLLPGAISKMVEHLLARPDVLAAYPDWIQIDGDGKVVQHIATYDYDYVNMLRWHHCMPGPGAFFRRALVEALGGRDTSFRYSSDFDFWLRAGLLGPLVRVPQTLATFRYHPSARSFSDRGLEMAGESVHMTDKVFATPSLPPEVQKVRREAYSSAYYKAGIQCGEAAPAARRRYFLLALLYAPHKYLTEYRNRWRMMLPALLGRFYEPFRRSVRPVVRGLRTVRKRSGVGGA